LIIWSLILIISLKYAILILRADNRGEGGIVALLALLSARQARPGTWRAGVLMLGLLGAALLAVDGFGRTLRSCCVTLWDPHRWCPRSRAATTEVPQWQHRRRASNPRRARQEQTKYRSTPVGMPVLSGSSSCQNHLEEAHLPLVSESQPVRVLFRDDWRRCCNYLTDFRARRFRGREL
jgi:hypothetical protein